MRGQTLAVFLLISISPPLFAQGVADEPVKVGDVTISGWLRTRGEVWDWFPSSANSRYAFSESIFRLAFTESKESFDWKIELGIPFLFALPNNAIAPTPQGQLGFGGNYFANAHTTDTASVFPKQAYGRFKLGKGEVKQSLLLGRSEFFDGLEVIPLNPTLAAVKRDRIAQRLIGNFGFSDIGRSFDGGVYAVGGSRTNLTLFASRPTRGVYQVDGWGEINIALFYGALTRQVGGGHSSGEWRVFGLGYDDTRGNDLKIDNRPAAIRALDRQGINIATAGGHYIHALQTNAGTFDFLLWGALQGGSWGVQAQRAYAYAAEAGWQMPVLSSVKPWLRGGYNYGSGDNNPNDATHGTFFQILPTARQYARFPFFNMMNNRDAFGELILRPSKALTLRSDIHALALANRHDLWYSGGGAFQPWTFGYIGRPSNGQSGLATLYDISVDYTLNQHFAPAVYYGHASGKLVIQDIYPQGRDANFGYVELNYRF
ncbi:MAG: alginate export family protein [Acidobacteriota bacterium]|nr:alginate export family protein [Acidobacteriota bacterium]